jgi:anti-sigma regulatory factor (Ser/Thr protein kinase)
LGNAGKVTRVGGGSVTSSDWQAEGGLSSPPPGRRENTIDLQFRGGPEAAALARRSLRKLRGDIDSPLMETMRLLVTELVANSVRHTGSDRVRLKVLVGRAAVLVEVSDSGPGFDYRRRRSTDADESGWGLFLVERLANRWGVGRDGASTRVWFELRRV